MKREFEATKKKGGLFSLSVFCLWMGVSCVFDKKPPKVHASRTLEPNNNDVKNEFSVTFASPKGKASDASQISIIFNRPMVAMDRVDAKGPSLASLRHVQGEGFPLPEGHWQWLGSNTLLFVNEKPFPKAQEYEVTIPKGIKSLDGSALKEDFRFRFETQRPALLSVEAGSSQIPAKSDEERIKRMLRVNGDEWEREREEKVIRPTDWLYLSFNQPISPDEFRSSISLSFSSSSHCSRNESSCVQKQKYVPYTISSINALEHRVLKLTFPAPLPLDSLAKLTFKKDLKGELGPLPLKVKGGTQVLSTRSQGEKKDGESHGDAPVLMTFRTYGPQRVVIDCSYVSADTNEKEEKIKECLPDNTLYFSFTNEVNQKDVAKYVSVVPAYKLEFLGNGNAAPKREVAASVRLKAGEEFTVTVKPGLRDIYGQILSKSITKKFVAAHETPGLKLGLSGSVLEAKRDPSTKQIPVRSMNVERYSLMAHMMTEQDVLDQLQARRHSSSTRDKAEDYVQSLTSSSSRFSFAEKERIPRAYLNQVFLGNVDLNRIFEKENNRGGVAFIWIKPDQFMNAGQKSSSLSPQSSEIRSSVFDDDVSRMVGSTDLGVSTRTSLFGSYVWVTSLSSGKPVQNARVRVVSIPNKKEVATVFTDKDGVATIDQKAWKPNMLTAEPWAEPEDDTVFFVTSPEAKDWTYVTPRLNMGRFEPQVEFDLSGQVETRGVLFTERGIYKRGETLYLKGFFTQSHQKNLSSLKGKKVKLVAEDISGDPFWSKEDLLGPFGDVSAEVFLPSSLRLGDIVLRAHMADEKADSRIVAEVRAELASYKPAEFKVSVASKKKSYFPWESPQFEAHADYLFGAPMAAADATLSLTYSRGYFVPKGAEDLILDDSEFSTGTETASTSSGVIKNEVIKLDKKGASTISVPAAPASSLWATFLNASVEVKDLSRQVVYAEGRTILHPAEFYLGLKSQETSFFYTDRAIPVHVFAVLPDGQKRAGVPVEISLIKRSWTNVVETNSQGKGRYVSTVKDVQSARCALLTAALKPALCELRADSPGYYLVRAHAKDERGHEVYSSYSIYVTSPADTDGGVASIWAQREDKTLSLVLDKKTYEVGDTATVLIKNPFATAEAWVSLERDGVVRQFRQTVKGPLPQLSIPITEASYPNQYVSVLLVRGRVKDEGPGGGPLGPQYRYGYTNLVIDPESRRLNVSLHTKVKEYKPHEKVDVDIVVRGKMVGARAPAPGKVMLTFYAVDEGVLMLTAYKTPDLISTLLRSEPDAVSLFDSRYDLGGVFKFDPKGIDKGRNGGDGGGSPMRFDFRSTAYFVPSLLTDESGKAHVSFVLPDGLTTYRLMAVAASQDGRFGYGDDQIVTNKMLMARPAIPKFIRVGDEFEAGVVVNSKIKSNSEIAVGVDVKGLDVIGNRSTRIKWAENESREVRFKFFAKELGQASFTFVVKTTDGVKHSDSVTLTRDVLLPASAEVASLTGETRSVAAEQIGKLDGIRGDFGQLDLRLSSTALIGIEESAKGLFDYPYGCSEQLASKLIPAVAVADLSKTFHFEATGGGSSRAAVEKMIADLVARQMGDGGFGYWEESSRSDPWVSPHVLYSLHMAKVAGHHVSAALFDRGIHYMRNLFAEIAKASDPGKRSFIRPEYAFMLDVMAELGASDAGYMQIMYNERHRLPLFARALLAHAMVKAKMDQSQTKELVSELETHLVVEGEKAVVAPETKTGEDYTYVLDSDARTAAMILRALMAADPRHPLASKLARGLLSQRKNGAWRTTQENAWALMALNVYHKAQNMQNTPFGATVFLGGKEIFGTTFSGHLADRSMKRFPAAELLKLSQNDKLLQFQVAGDGQLFYSAKLTYAPSVLPHLPLDRGFSVHKTMRLLSLSDSGTWALKDDLKQTVKAGSVLLVDILVSSATFRNQVVIDDPLPAGLEAVRGDSSEILNRLGFRPVYSDLGQDKAARDESENGEEPLFVSHREMDDDKVMAYYDDMPAGIHHFRYLARATTLGTFVAPPTRVECMYEPEIYGRTASASFSVLPE